MEKSVHIVFHLAWFWWPVIFIIVGLFFLRLGSGGFLISLLFDLIAVVLIIGHFLPA